MSIRITASISTQVARGYVPTAGDIDPLLNQTIVVEDADLADLLDTTLTRDVVPTLDEMTGGSFEVVSSSSTLGVVRVQISEDLGPQEYSIVGSFRTDLIISGGTWRGCKHGLYAWLHEFGVLQIGLGERFRVVPSREDLRRVVDIQREPAVTTVQWSPQGNPSGAGWPWAGEVLLHNEEWYAFLDWNARPIGHHAGIDDVTTPEKQAFGGHYDGFAYEAKSADFDADPLHFAQRARDWFPSTLYRVGAKVANDGKRYVCVTQGTSASSGGPTGTGSGITDGSAAWDYEATGTRWAGVGYLHMTHDGTATGSVYSGSGGVIGIYADEVADRIDANQALVATHPEYTGLTFGLTCAVADGAFPDESEKSRDLLRNAFGIDADASGTDMSLHRNGRIYDEAKLARPSVDFEIFDLAYDWQSPPPTPGWTINQNLHIQLAQYSFNRDAYPFRALLNRWATSRDDNGFRLGIYDYWSLPTHSLGDARFHYSTAWSRVRDWLAADIASLTTETTMAAGATSLQYWGAFRMIWGGDEANSVLVDEYCTKAFGAGAEHMKRLFTRRWGQTWPVWRPTAYDFGLSFDDIHQADAAVTDDAPSRARVAAWMAYELFLHYRGAWATLEASTPSEAEADALAEEYLLFVWGARETFMIDVKYVHDTVLESSSVSSAFVTSWTIPADSADWPDWRTDNGIVDLSDADIRTAFETVRATYTKPTPAAHTAAIETGLVASYSPTGTTSYAENYVYGNEGPETGSVYIFQRRPGATGSITVDVTTTTVPASVRLILTNAETGELVSDDDEELQLFIDGLSPGEIYTQTYELETLPTGFYKLVVENRAAHRITHQREIPIVRCGSYDRIVWLGAALPSGPTGWYPRFFFVPKGVTQFHILHTLGSSDVEFKVRDGDDNLVTKTEILPGTFRVDVPAGHDQEVWRLDNDANYGTPRLLDIPEWTSPTREQIIVPTNLWDE